jgi:dihydroxyacid dehydratase/phosphogluconate dehydratase
MPDVGTAFGTIVLHVAPEAAVGGAGASGDGGQDPLSREGPRIDLLVEEGVLAERARPGSPCPRRPAAGTAVHEQIRRRRWGGPRVPAAAGGVTRGA